MAKDLNSLMKGVSDANSAKGKTFRLGGGGVGFKKGDIITLPTAEDFEAGNGAKIEVFDATREDGYYVQIAVRINNGDWVFVPSGTFSRGLYPVKKNKDGVYEPTTMSWPSGGPEMRIVRSEDPFAKRIRMGGDVYDTLAGAIRSLGCNQLQVVDAMEVEVLEYQKTDVTRIREAYKYEAYGATTSTSSDQASTEGSPAAK